MRLSWRALASGPMQAILAAIVTLYLKLVGVTTRWQREGFAEPLARLAQGQPMILCFWHGRLAAMPLCHPERRRAAVLISAHRDGRLIARTIRHFGLATIDGSSTRGGEAGLVECARHLTQGGVVAIAPDGPRGPRMRAAAGALKLASVTGAPVFPVSVATSRRRVLPSWDRFLLPLPFGRGLFLVGEAITLPREADGAALETARRTLEARLNALSAEADRRMGQAPIEPAPASPAGAAPAKMQA